MGVKRFLVVGGMASLVLMGVLLIVDAESMAKDTRGDAAMTWVDQNTPFDPDDPPTPKEGKTWVDQNTPFDPDNFDPRNPDTANPDTANPDTANRPPPQEEIAGIGMGNMGDQQAPSGGGAGGGTGGTGGGGGATLTITDLPETGGLSVVFLITSAILLGSGLLTVTVVRSIRS